MIFLRYVLKQTYDPYIKYGIKQIPEYTESLEHNTNTINKEEIIKEFLSKNRY